MRLLFLLCLTLLQVSPLLGTSILFKNSTIIDLASCEFKCYSQNGEDGVIKKIFDCIGVHSRYYVEIGTENGSECNTRYLRENGWTGLLLDGAHENPAIHLYKEFITAENINYLLNKFIVPYEFDLLSIDIDYNDFYVWHSINDRYRPRVVIMEYNATHLPNEDKIVIYNPKGVWDGTNYFGASLLALYNLGRYKGYSLVYANSNGVNLFFIRDDVLRQMEIKGIRFKDTNDVNALYRFPKYGYGPNGGHMQDSCQRPFSSSQEILSSR